MKPDWNDAPEWAEWLAMDSGGAWYWYEREPERAEFSWQPSRGGKMASAGVEPPEDFHCYWWESLECRPKEQAMKFKIGDRVVLARTKPRSEYDQLLLKQQCADGCLKVYRVCSDDFVLVGGVRSDDKDQWYVNVERLDPYEPDRTPTERRLIEALRPFAHISSFLCDDLPVRQTVPVHADKLRQALNLLRELGEYPGTCKECGQEIRK